MIAVPISVSDPSEVADALLAAEDVRRRGADVIEWRVDTLVETQEAGVRALKTLVAESPAQAIVTVRSEEEGGQCDQDDASLATWFQDLLDCGVRPTWVDVEYARWLRSDDLQAVLKQWQADGVRVLLSSHDFVGRPRDLHQRVAAMQEAPCDAVKMVWRARSLRDGLECRELLAARQKPMIALCMGPAGMMSRVMTGAWGGLLTFASASHGAASAPGQPTIDELLEWYRFRTLNKDTAIYGLIGDPIGHSPGFIMHNRAFEQADINAVYLPMPVAGGWESLKATLAELVGRSDIMFRGASVTLPHKQDLVRFVQEHGGSVSKTVQSCGAANTLTVLQDGAICIDNTDVMGITQPLIAAGWQPEGAQVAVLGAGGVARAAAAALLPLGASVHVFNRSRDRAEELVEALRPLGELQVGCIEAGPFDVVVQATPLGMAHGEHPNESPWQLLGMDPQSCMATQSLALETIYDPIKTPFVNIMLQAGVKVLTGQDMWLAQASGQLDAWCGYQPPPEVWKL